MADAAGMHVAVAMTGNGTEQRAKPSDDGSDGTATPSIAGPSPAGASCDFDDVASEMRVLARARVGTTIKGKWTLERLLGIGGMAAVYAGVHRNGNRVAVKILHSLLATNALLRERFLREAYAANAVGHPGVARVLDDDSLDDGTPFLLMELLSGETLDARWRRHDRKLPLPEVLGIVDELLAVLSAAHAKGVHHRDIKPENVFITQAGRVKVLDFGIAHLREGLLGATSATRTGALLGTPAFMPPEQARGRRHEIDARSDLWAVGATMFTLLTGRNVHVSEYGNELLIFAATERAPSLADINASMPAEVVTLVDKALSFEREGRFADASQMRAAIHAVQRRLGIPAVEMDHSAVGLNPLVETMLPPPRALSYSGPTLAHEQSPSPLPTVLPSVPPPSTSPSVLSVARPPRLPISWWQHAASAAAIVGVLACAAVFGVKARSWTAAPPSASEAQAVLAALPTPVAAPLPSPAPRKPEASLPTQPLDESQLPPSAAPSSKPPRLRTKPAVSAEPRRTIPKKTHGPTSRLRAGKSRPTP